MERRSYTWFEKRRKSKALELAQKQITKALDTVTLLNQAIKQISEGKKTDGVRNIENLYSIEEEVDALRTEVLKEVSAGAALFSEYREDWMHLVKRLDMLADHVKDAARCAMMLLDAKIPGELWKKTANATSTLLECATALRSSLESVSVEPAAAIEGARKVEEIESKIDKEYLEIKSLFIGYSDQVNCGAIVIFDDMIEFIEQAADMCADTADYIVILASRE